MIRLIKQEKLDDLKDFNVIVPSNYELYYKRKYVNNDYKIFTFRNFILNKYEGSKKLVNEFQNYIIMYEALKEVSDDLLVYKNFISYGFVNELIKTYDEFYRYDLVYNDKINDLKIIFDKYDEKLSKNNLINEKVMFDEVLNNALFNDKYLFLNVSLPDKNVIKLINKMSLTGDVFLSVDINNNMYLKECLNELNLCLEDKENKFLSDNNKVLFKPLNDVSDEVSFINNDISKKIMEEYHYDDFLIVCDKTIYEPYFDLIFSHPYSKTDEKGILTSRFISIFTNILNGDFSCNNFINLLKLGLFEIDMKIIDRLDNYIYSWDLENENFYLKFKYNPNGNKKSFTKEDEKNLNELNDAKDSIINPLRCLLENIVGEDNKETLLRTLYTYFSEEGIINKLFELDEEGLLKLISALESINDCLENKTSLQDIINVLNNICLISSKQIKNQDQILISNLENALYEDKKFVYLLGATSDDFPKEFKLNSLISIHDINKSNLINELKKNKDKWNYLFFKLLNNEELMITYPKLGIDLKLKNPSNFINLIDKEEINDDVIYDKNLMIKNYALLLSEEKMNVFDDERFKNINDSNRHDLNLKIKKESAESLYTKNLKVSPSSIETYAKCPFYHFCQYGLKLKVKEKHTFDNREIGTFVHYVLERIISNDLNDISVDNLDKYVTKYASCYLEDNGKVVNNSVNYLIHTLSKNVSMVIKNIIKEQEISNFKPRYFEFRIDDKAIVKPVDIKLDHGRLIINGVVDRVDVYEDEENYYYRIIDYKTGDKKFRLDEVLVGLNLQMLLYLLAIKENSNDLTNKQVVPSGLLYYPALVKEKPSSRGLDLSLKENTITERLRMNGIINYDSKVLEALGGDELGSFLNVLTRTKLSDEKIFGMDNLNLLFKNIKSTLKNIGNDILNGKISVSPIFGSDDACSFCKFSSICKFDSSIDKKRKVKNYKNSEVFKMLEGDLDA